MATASPTTQDLLLQLRGASKGGTIGLCKFGAWFAELDDPVLKEAIELAQADKQISKQQIVMLACGRGYTGALTVGRSHLSGTCACFRGAK